MKNNTKKLVLGALLAALTTAATLVIRIPSPGTNGYINPGDTIVLLSAWVLGGWYGAAAAGIGSSLADIFGGYTHYAPGTFVIKSIMAFAAYMVFKRSRRFSIPQTIRYILSGIAAETIMMLGYLLYEYFFLGYGPAAFVSMAGNAFQGAANIILAILLASALAKTKLPGIMTYGDHTT